MREKVKSKEIVIFISLCFLSVLVFAITYGIILKNNTVKASAKTGESISIGSASLKGGAITHRARFSSSQAEDELRGIWISFLEFYKGSYTEEEFTSRVDEMLDECVNYNINTIFFHVRPSADSFYDSDYFPWSKQLTGVYGKDPGYDPLEYMVEAAHARNLKIHAWINPYRVTLSGTDLSALPSGHPAKRWSTSKDSAKKRNVLSYGEKIYFNPAKKAVRNLIVNGVTEIVENYDVDGIHFDDYFYPNLGTDYQKNFDAKEYKTYVKNKKESGEDYLSIENWRRRNVNLLIKEVYAAIKETDSSVEFGISPAGELNNLYSNVSYYCDVKKWMASKKYIDYICPQIYWSFEHPIAAFDKIADQWNEIPRSKTVKLYAGLAAYRAGISKKEAKAIKDPGWAKSRHVLMDQVEYLYYETDASGWILFRYDNIVSDKLSEEMDNLLSFYED